MMWGAISCSSSNLLLALLAAMVACLSMAPHPAAVAAATSANLIHHEGGGGSGGGERNPANALVAAVNANRTAAGLPPLRNSKGLGCMALQCISHCATATTTSTDACDDDAGARALAACHPPETDITEVYAANCGVELPTVDLITARLLGCSAHDADLLLLGPNANATAVHGKEHTQVGAGLLRPRRHGPYFWCLLFSSGSPASTFRLEAAGKGIAQAHGCFSDPDDALSCSSAGRLSTSMAAALLLLPLFLLS